MHLIMHLLDKISALVLDQSDCHVSCNGTPGPYLRHLVMFGFLTELKDLMGVFLGGFALFLPK